jgi:hypothetical protein
MEAESAVFGGILLFRTPGFSFHVRDCVSQLNLAVNIQLQSSRLAGFSYEALHARRNPKSRFRKSSSQSRQLWTRWKMIIDWRKSLWIHTFQVRDERCQGLFSVAVPPLSKETRTARKGERGQQTFRQGGESNNNDMQE